MLHSNQDVAALGREPLAPKRMSPAAQFAQLVSYGIIEKRDEQYRDYFARLSRDEGVVCDLAGEVSR